MNSRWAPSWPSLGWKAIASLPLVGATFWLMTGWIDNHVLSQTQPVVTQLEAEGRHRVQLSLALTIVSIDADINRSTQVTEVSIRAIGSPLEEMEFKFPVTEFADVEKAIAQELNLSQAEIQQLIRYRIDE